MARQLHLNKSGAGMAAMTACGRNILRTPLSANWDDFKVSTYQCIKCTESRQAALNARRDAELWIPEAPDAWMAADAALIAKRRAAVGRATL